MFGTCSSHLASGHFKIAYDMWPDNLSRLNTPSWILQAEPRLHAHPCHLTSPPTHFNPPPCFVCRCCHANARCLFGWQSFAKMYNNTPGIHVHSKHVPNYFEELSKSKFW